ncbi:M23/M37 family peptidase [Mucinivorans hirudinis]|uniref:M23/M37 family peptidase n=1 Tax=Mucinivorans hirudinis TaxID=1433126 RepID=A0A060R9M4_9BACT|nr:M23/M37 family peptidase [Mucinivorans hirudinis]
MHIVINIFQMKRIAIIFFAILLTCASQAQTRKRSSSVPKQRTIEEMPRVAIDTVTTADPETKVIIYSNNSWEFYHPAIKERLADLDVYKYNWDTTQIFAYKNIELTDLPELIELRLIDSLVQYCAPATGRVSSKYGIRRRRNHNGTDLSLPLGVPFHATFDGKVRYAKWNSGGYGYLTIIRHPNGLESWYAHQSKLNVKPGDYVKAGQIIGFCGNSGRSRGNHLHFELRYKDQSFDSEFLIDFETGQLRYQTFVLDKKYFNIRSRASEILEEDDYDADLPESLLADADETTIENVQSAPKPKPAQATTGAIYHTIVKGDNLGKIAIKYGVPIDQICSLNGINRSTTLALKRKLLIKK